MASGMGVAWILLADTVAGSLIILALSGILLWTRLHGPRLLAAGLGLRVPNPCYHLCLASFLTNSEGGIMILNWKIWLSTDTTKPCVRIASIRNTEFRRER